MKATYDGQCLGDHSEKTEHKRELSKDLHIEVRKNGFADLLPGLSGCRYDVQEL